MAIAYEKHPWQDNTFIYQLNLIVDLCIPFYAI